MPKICKSIQIHTFTHMRFCNWTLLVFLQLQACSYQSSWLPPDAKPSLYLHVMSLLCNALCHPLGTLNYESILRTNSICSDCSLHSGSDLSVSSLPVMHRVIRKLWMDRPTFKQPAGEQCSLNTPPCRQSTGKQYQRGGSTWGRGFHIAPRCLEACWDSSLTLALSLPLITATCWKPFMGNVQKLSVRSLFSACVYVHMSVLPFGQAPDIFYKEPKTCRNAQCQLQRGRALLVIFLHLNQSDLM